MKKLEQCVSIYKTVYLISLQILDVSMRRTILLLWILYPPSNTQKKPERVTYYFVIYLSMMHFWYISTSTKYRSTWCIVTNWFFWNTLHMVSVRLSLTGKIQFSQSNSCLPSAFFISATSTVRSVYPCSTKSTEKEGFVGIFPTWAGFLSFCLIDCSKARRQGEFLRTKW